MTMNSLGIRVENRSSNQRPGRQYWISTLHKSNNAWSGPPSFGVDTCSRFWEEFI